jgi:hypothetical protein
MVGVDRGDLLSDGGGLADEVAPLRVEPLGEERAPTNEEEVRGRREDRVRDGLDQDLALQGIERADPDRVVFGPPGIGEEEEVPPVRQERGEAVRFLAAGVPPPAATRYRASSSRGAKTITPSEFQAPPEPAGASQRA